MKNATILLKVEERLNKRASGDYDNLECWQVFEAFNKEQILWAREQIGGNNIRKEGAEQSIRRIDDLQFLLTPKDLKGTDQNLFFQSDDLPDDYLAFSRLTANVIDPRCRLPILMIVHLVEEANRDNYLRDEHVRPSLEWAETFGTMVGNQMRVYTENKFKVKNIELMYYRKPAKVTMAGCVDTYTQQEANVDVECEFKEDIIELLIERTAAHLAGDIENFNQAQRGDAEAQAAN